MATSLPGISQIGSIGANIAGDVATGSTVSSAATNAGTAISNGITGAVKSFFGNLTFTLEDFLFIFIGTLLIAAGIFAFKSTQTVIQTGGKLGVKAAELTA